MRRRTAGVVLSVLAASAAAAHSGIAQAAPSGQDGVRTTHQRIVDYWTPERMASAEPRDVVVAGSESTAQGDGQDRVVKGVWEDPDAPVARTTGKVFFLLGGVPSTCSASAVDHGGEGVDLVLTAGHCVWGRTGAEPEGVFADFFLFVPGYYGGFVPDDPRSFVEYDLWTAEQLFTTAGWQDGRYGDDTGVAVVSNPTMSFEGKLGELPQVAVPGRAVTLGSTVSTFGYPSGRNYKGRDLGWCQSPLEEGTAFPGTLALRCQLSGGASGGPWYSDPRGTGEIFSLNSFEVRGDNRVHGPVFDGAEAALLAAAEDGDCGPDEVCAEVPGASE